MKASCSSWAPAARAARSARTAPTCCVRPTCATRSRATPATCRAWLRPAYNLGSPYPEIDYAGGLPGRFEDPAFVNPECIMIWGKAPLASNPDGFFGHAVVDMMRRGARLIVVDPRITWLSSRADYHLRVRPGTDAALAMAMLNTIIQEDLYDHDFVEYWCYGFEQLAERVAEMPAEKAGGDLRHRSRLHQGRRPHVRQRQARVAAMGPCVRPEHERHATVPIAPSASWRSRPTSTFRAARFWAMRTPARTRPASASKRRLARTSSAR